MDISNVIDLEAPTLACRASQFVDFEGRARERAAQLVRSRGCARAERLDRVATP